MEDILEKEKKEKERCQILREKERSRLTLEDEKKKIRLELKKTLELKWKTVRWASDHLDRNEAEFDNLLKDLEENEIEELNKWRKMERFEKIEKSRQEQGFNEEKTEQVEKE